MPVLPAPADVRAAAITNRLSRLSPAAAAAGPSSRRPRWRLELAAGLGRRSPQLDDVATAVDELVSRPARRAPHRRHSGSVLRLAHGLVRSAVYQEHPARVTSRALHLRAATIVDRNSRRCSSTAWPPRSPTTSALADDLEGHANGMREQQDFGAAARFLRLSSRVTPDPITRERRWLDSLADSAAAVGLPT